MQKLWVHRDIEAPPAVVWDLLTDPARWPEWGPTVQAAEIASDRLRLGTRGTVTTVFGLRLPFEITAFDEGTRWGWAVAGIGATDHSVHDLGSDRCRAGFAVAWPAAPYLAVCRIALSRLGTIATSESVGS